MSQDHNEFSGIHIETPRQSWNPAGQAQLIYRTGTQETFLRSMLARLSSGSEFPALQALTSRSDDDLTVALLDAWATVADVLTFYQERLANEAFLRTATEAESIQYLARLLGYERERGVAAATYLSFTVDESAGAPLTISLPAGLPTQSIPLEADQLPQTYETDETITIRAAWNSMQARLREPPTIALEDGSLYIKGTANNLNTGDFLLFVNEGKDGNNGEGATTATAWALRRLIDVSPDPGSGRTQLLWSKGDLSGSLGEDQQSLRLYALRQRAAIFGHNAAQWSMLPDTAMATYLGIANPATLSAVEKAEWPDFVVPAPRYPLEAEPTIRHIPPTVDSVIAAILTASDGVNQAATMCALTALPNAAVEALAALSQTVSAILTIGSGLSGADTSSNNTSGAGNDDTAYVDGLANALNTSFGKLLFNFPPDNTPPNIFNPGSLTPNQMELPSLDLAKLGSFISDAFSTPSKDDMDDLAASFNDFIESNPLVASLLIFSDDAVATALTDAAEKNKAAADAILGLPGTLAKAASAIFMAHAVKMAIQALSTMPIPLPLTPELVAFVGIFVARFFETLLAPGDAATDFGKDLAASNDPIADLIKILDDAANFESQSDVADAAEAAAASTVVASASAAVIAGTVVAGTAVIGTTIAGAAATGAVGGLYTGLGAALIAPAIGPILLAGVALSATLVLVGPEIAEGAHGAADTIVKAANAALEPAQEIARERFLRGDNSIDLDKQYNRISPDSWLVLQRPDAKAKLYRVQNVTHAARSEYNLNAQVTRVHLDQGTGSWYGLTPAGYNALVDFLDRVFTSKDEFDEFLEDIPESNVPAYVGDVIKALPHDWFGEISLPNDDKGYGVLNDEGKIARRLFDHLLGRVFESKTEFDAFLDNLRGLAVDDLVSDMAEELIEELKQNGLKQDAPLFPFHYEVRATAVLGHSDKLEIVDKPVETPVPAVKDESNVTESSIIIDDDDKPVETPVPVEKDVTESSIILDDDAIPWLPAGRTLIVTGKTVASPHPIETEVVTVTKCEKNSEGLWALTLANQTHAGKGLIHCYQRNHVRILGNVARATHGQSEEEVIGSGDGSAANQSFELSNDPLTYIADDSASGRSSTLEVRVNGIRWQEAARPTDLHVGQEAYTTHVTPGGAFLVRFGDGQAGSRLPTGEENVVARYRVGTGVVGNNPAGQITILTQRPPGLRSVTNPLPASGGGDPESPEAIRARAPHSVRSFERVVSLSDYVDFATTFAGVGKAFATWYWRGTQKVIYLAIAPGGGQPLSDEDKLLENLKAALQRAGEPDTMLDLEEVALRQFGLSARLWLDPRYEKADRLAAARKALTTTFSFERQSFGAGINRNRILRCLQAIPGVIGVDVTNVTDMTVVVTDEAPSEAPCEAPPVEPSVELPEVSLVAPLPRAGRVIRPDPIPLWTINLDGLDLVAQTEGEST